MGPERAAVASRAFTLLELLVTLFVIVVAVGLVVPTIGKSVDAVRARSEVAAFAAFFRHAREQAITRRESERVVVDPDAHRLTLVVGEDTIRETRVVPARLDIEPVTPGGLVVRFDPEGTSSGGAFRLTSGGTTYRVTVEAATGRVRSARE
jgi:prepilin-type N-terminal cleavage/methylation domain-containing protein